jgi:hypothetical protein
MKQLFFSLVAITLFSFKGMSQNESIQGYIYVKLIDVHNMFGGLPDKIIKQLSDSINNPNYNKNHTKFEIQGFEYFKFLIENKFIHKPHFKLKLESGKLINVFVEDREYLKLKKKLKGLEREKERINLKCEGIKKSDGFFDEAIYYADKITLVEKVLGETDWKK